MACSMCGKQTRAPMERCYRPGCPGRSGAPLPAQKPQPYRCPICKSSDPNHFMLCDYPGCPDGREWNNPNRPSNLVRNPADSYQEPMGAQEGLSMIEKAGWGVVGFLVCLIFIGWMLMK